MRSIRWIILGIFTAALLFLALLEERSLTQLSYRRGSLCNEIVDLEKQNADLKARLERKVNPAALRRMASDLGLGQAAEGAR